METNAISKFLFRYSALISNLPCVKRGIKAAAVHSHGSKVQPFCHVALTPQGGAAVVKISTLAFYMNLQKLIILNNFF